MSFLPDDYKAPKTSSNYMKIQQGENKIRILSRPIFGWEDWEPSTNKPVRFQFHEKPAKQLSPSKKISHFWAFIVWNYAEERIQILQITQSGIRSAIESLSRDDDWGAPWNYDLKIVRTGKEKETKYAVTPASPKALSETIRSAFYENRIRLEALFDGQDPFAVGSGDYTEPAFEKEEKEEKASDAANAGIEALKAELVTSGLPIHNLEKYISKKAKDRKVTEEKYISAILNPAVLGPWIAQYEKEAGKIAV
jgi:hypothetical protein